MAEKKLLSNMSYTNKSFQDIYPELLDLVKKISYRWNPSESNESDPGVVLLKLCAIIADKCNYNIDKNILECFPASVTQDSNARELFAQLGYYMHWYQAATSTVHMYWKKEDTSYIYSVPRFTMVSDEENNIVYTITSDVKLNSNGDVTECPVIQGTILDFLINGESKITVNNLDSNNRIYFSSFNVAENGIFIKNSLYGYDDWRRVDNLAIEELGQPVYKFGITRDGNSCYLEFPEDAFNLFADGLSIKYISTDGVDGNISAHILNKFFNEPAATYGENNSESITLTSDNTVVYNNSSIRNGSNPETIEDAYKNYKKTIGTFNTLVTLRDYNNAIRTAKSNGINLVSNGFVCDRTNDIQCSYKIVTDTDDIQKKVLAVEDDLSTKRTNSSGVDSYDPYITAFDLKLYLLENIISADNTDSAGDKQTTKGAKFYNTTFTPLNNNEHKTSYVVDMLKHSLEDNKSLQHDFQQILSNKICMIKNRYPINCKVITQYKLTSVQADDVRNNIYKSLYNGLNARKVEFGEEVSYDKIYDIIINSDERIKSIMLDNITYTTYAVYYDKDTEKYCEVDLNDLDKFVVGRYDDSIGKFYKDSSNTIEKYDTSTVYVDLNTGKCYKYTDGKLSENLKAEFQTEIYAKSALSGTTQLLEPDNMFNYRMHEKYVESAKDVSNVTTNTDIRLASTNGAASYTLKNNESIKFYAPNLEDKTNYSTYVKIQYSLNRDIEANSDYMLSDSESIVFYWKNSDDDGAPYEYYKYGKGTIIHPDFTMSAAYGYINGSQYHGVDNIRYIACNFDVGKHTCSIEDSNYLAKISDNNYILTATKTISIRGKVEKSLKYPYRCYWILNNKHTTASGAQVYKLFNAVSETDTDSKGNKLTKQQYILQPGEYFIYTDAAKTGAEMFEAGTRITRTFVGGHASEMSCEIVDSTKYESMGIEALNNLFKYINSNETITLTEMQIISVPSDAEISINANKWREDTAQSVTDGQTPTGIELNGHKVGPNETNLSAYTSSKAYNLNYDDAWGWHEDVDSDGEDLYVSSVIMGESYSKNIDLVEVASKYKMDPIGKTPTELGVFPGKYYVKIYASHAPEFEKNLYYEFKEGYENPYVLLNKVPADWETNYSNYYYEKPFHAYNSKYDTNIIWKNDSDENFPSDTAKTPYSVLWKEDSEYLALGYKISESDSDKNPSVNLPIDTYHAYNPKYKSNGYAWIMLDDNEKPENFNSCIKISGVNCSPNSCLLVPEDQGFKCYNADTKKSWVAKRIINTLDELNEDKLVWTAESTYSGPVPDDPTKSSRYLVRLTGESNPSNNQYVQLALVEGLRAVNIAYNSAIQDEPEYKYFKVSEIFTGKSWTQVITYPDNIDKLSAKEADSSPTTEGLIPIIDKHVCNKYKTRVWLEDYTTADGTDSLSFINGAGLTPTDANIDPFSNVRVLNSEYAYEFKWQEDPEYTQWPDPVAILTGETSNPENSKISVNNLGQHVINPDYKAGTKWVVWDSYNGAPPYSGSDAKVDFENDDALAEPPSNLSENVTVAYNTTTDTWWVRAAVAGKSWTSVKVSISKSWTSYEVEASSSWTGVKEYIGKSWYSLLSPVARFWSSVGSPVDVVFNNSGVIINKPEGATLNDLDISSKLSTSKEYETLPKVLIDGEGWEAHSSLDLMISRNTPLVLNEGQSLTWYTPYYNENNPDDIDTNGKMQGIYEWDDEIKSEDSTTSNDESAEYSSIYSIKAIDINNAGAIVHQSKMYLEDILIKADAYSELHVYDKKAKKSWSSNVSYKFESRGLIKDIDADTENIQIGWVEIDCTTDEEFNAYLKDNNIIPAAGMCYFHIKEDGNIIVWESVKSDDDIWSQDSDDNYAEVGVEIIGDPNDINGIKLPAQQGLMVNVYTPSYNDGDSPKMVLYCNYRTLCVVSDYGYDLQGGIKIDVSRQSLNDENYYMNLYAYEIMSYKEPFMVDNNSLKIDLNNLNGQTSADYTIDFNFPNGKYLLTFMNSATPISVLTMQIVALNYNEEIGKRYDLHEFGDVSFKDFSKSRKYYIDFDTSNFEKLGNGFRIILHLSAIDDIKGYLRFDSAYKYTTPEPLSHDEDLFKAVLNKVMLLDKDRQYDYAYVVDKDVLIDNPLKAENFLDPNHMYNQFTICQMDLASSYVHITNVSK